MIFSVEVLQGFMDALQGIWATSGFLGNDPRNYIMILISLVLLYLAIKKEFEPLLLLPIAFGMLLVNVFPGITATPSTEMQLVTDYMRAWSIIRSRPTADCCTTSIRALSWVFTRR